MRVLLAAVARARGAADPVLGRVTAVLLVAGVLWVIAIAALVLMLVGALPFDPGAGVLSLIVAVGAAFAGVWLGGAIVRARPEI